MRLNHNRLDRLQRSLELALNQEWPQLSATQSRLGKIAPKPIPIAGDSSSALSAVATVASDRGENRLSLQPIEVQIIRVADRLGEIYFEDFVAQSLTPEEILRFFFQSNERLQRFIKYLDLEWGELLPRTDFQRSQMLSILRELMEWAALMKLASQHPPKLLIRDGLLRSVLLTDLVFARLRERFEGLTAKHGHLLVGVAKRSRVVSYLSVALDLNATLASGEPAYIRIPPDIEQQAAPSQDRWIGSRAMGLLHIAQLDRGESVPLMPVDGAQWQEERTDEAMTLLYQSAHASFPMRGYPQALVQAHEHAHLGGLEIEVLERMLLDQIAGRDPAVARTTRRLVLLGKQLSKPLSKEEDEH